MKKKYQLQIPITMSPQRFITFMQSLLGSWDNFIYMFNELVEKSRFEIDPEDERMHRVMEMCPDCFKEIYPRKIWTLKDLMS